MSSRKSVGKKTDAPDVQQSLAQEKTVFRYETFENKYNHPTASKLRKKVDEVIASYLECDWPQTISKKQGTPQATIISLYRYIESELFRLGLLDPTQPQGGGVPPMDDTQTAYLRGHIEKFVVARVSEKTFTIGPITTGYETYEEFVSKFDLQHSTSSTSSRLSKQGSVTISGQNMGNIDSQFHFSTLSERLAFLRFLSLNDLGLGYSTSYMDRISKLLQATPGSIKGALGSEQIEVEMSFKSSKYFSAFKNFL
jgi:hypothetical protein